MDLKTARLTLTPMNLSYLNSTFEYACDLENTKFMMFLPYDSYEETEETIKDSERQWQSETPLFHDFAILYEGKHIGSIALYFMEDPQKAELGWIIHRNFWGRGIVTEAALEMLNYAKSLNIRSVIACCDSENTGSYRVMEKIGMHRVSCLGGRKNRSSNEEKFELIYEIFL